MLRWGLEEEWGMRYSSNDGACEKIEIYFSEQEVRAYCEVVERTYKGVVPLLMCANVWPKFKLFQKFEQEHILLVRTTCEEFEPLKCRLKYEAYLTHIFIRQTFIKKEVNDEV